MPTDPDADDLEISDIGVDAIFRAAGLATSPRRPEASAGSAETQPGPSAATREPPGALDFDDADLGDAFDDLLPAMTDAGLSGIDLEFFEGPDDDDLWTVPDPAPLVETWGGPGHGAVRSSGALNRSARLDEERLPTAVADRAARAANTAEPGSNGQPVDAFAGIVQRRRSSSADAEISGIRSTRSAGAGAREGRGSDSRSSPGEHNGRMLARTRVATRVFPRTDAADSSARQSGADSASTPPAFGGSEDSSATIFVARPAPADSDPAATPRPNGDDLLRAWAPPRSSDR